jgi:hypothetical protein
MLSFENSLLWQPVTAKFRNFRNSGRNSFCSDINFGSRMYDRTRMGPSRRSNSVIFPLPEFCGKNNKIKEMRKYAKYLCT